MKHYYIFLGLLMLLAVPVYAQSPAFSVESAANDTLFQVNTDGSVRIDAPDAKDRTEVLVKIDERGNTGWQPDGLTLPYRAGYTGTANALRIDHDGSQGHAARFSSGNPDPTVSITKQGTGFGLHVSGIGVASAARFTGDVLFNGGATFAPNSGVGTAAFGIPTTFSEAVTFDGGVQMNNGMTLSGFATLEDINVIEQAGFSGGLISAGNVILTAGREVSCTDCVGPEDVDESKGFYVSRSQIYTNVVPIAIPVGTIGTETARCNDTNDLPLNGACYSLVSSDAELHSFRSQDWNASGIPAGYRCNFRNAGSSEQTAEAHITCLAVDGE